MTNIKPCPECGGECVPFKVWGKGHAVICIQCEYQVQTKTKKAAIRLHNSIPRD